MLYQLPNGKVIQLSIDQYLALTDQDLQYLVAINYGETITSPWYNSISTEDLIDNVEYPTTNFEE